MDTIIKSDFRFPFTRIEIDILLSFLEEGQLSKVAHRLHKDPTVISRQIQNMINERSFFEKHNGKWKLSPLGLQVAERLRIHLLEIQEICKNQARIILVTTPDFGSRVLPSVLDELDELDIFFDIICSHSSIEKMLLDGKADLAIECGRPHSPLIRFKQIVPESLSLIYPKSWNIEYLDQILKRPAIHYIRINLATVLNLKENLSESKYRTNNISMAIELVRLKKGWTIIPTYTVKKDLVQKNFKTLDIKFDSQLKFGLWWPIDRPIPTKIFQKLSLSLSKVTLNDR